MSDRDTPSGAELDRVRRAVRDVLAGGMESVDAEARATLEAFSTGGQTEEDESRRPLWLWIRDALATRPPVVLNRLVDYLLDWDSAFLDGVVPATAVRSSTLSLLATPMRRDDLERAVLEAAKDEDEAALVVCGLLGLELPIDGATVRELLFGEAALLAARDPELLQGPVRQVAWYCSWYPDALGEDQRDKLLTADDGGDWLDAPGLVETLIERFPDSCAAVVDHYSDLMPNGRHTRRIARAIAGHANDGVLSSLLATAFHEEEVVIEAIAAGRASWLADLLASNPHPQLGGSPVLHIAAAAISGLPEPTEYDAPEGLEDFVHAVARWVEAGESPQNLDPQLVSPDLLAYRTYQRAGPLLGRMVQNDMVGAVLLVAEWQNESFEEAREGLAAIVALARASGRSFPELEPIRRILLESPPRDLSDFDPDPVGMLLLLRLATTEDEFSEIAELVPSLPHALGHAVAERCVLETFRSELSHIYRIPVLNALEFRDDVSGATRAVIDLLTTGGPDECLPTLAIMTAACLGSNEDLPIGDSLTQTLRRRYPPFQDLVEAGLVSSIFTARRRRDDSSTPSNLVLQFIQSVPKIRIEKGPDPDMLRKVSDLLYLDGDPAGCSHRTLLAVTSDEPVARAAAVATVFHPSCDGDPLAEAARRVLAADRDDDVLAALLDSIDLGGIDDELARRIILRGFDSTLLVDRAFRAAGGGSDRAVVERVVDVIRERVRPTPDNAMIQFMGPFWSLNSKHIAGALGEHHLAVYDLSDTQGLQERISSDMLDVDLSAMLEDRVGESLRLLLIGLEKRVSMDLVRAHLGRHVIIRPLGSTPPEPGGLTQKEFESLALHLSVLYVEEETDAIVAEVVEEPTGEVLNAIFEEEAQVAVEVRWG